jgi:alginate O-acetyltransferase complex protein AlgJ
MMQKLFNILLSSIFFLMVSAPFITHCFHDNESFLMSEKRKLAERPNIPSSWHEGRKFPQRFEAYLNDQFGLRAKLLDTYSRLRWNLGMNVNSKVLRGKDGWLFLGQENKIIEQYLGINRFENGELLDWVEAMQARKNWLAERKIPFIIVVSPNKHSIYPEKLPGNIGIKTGPTRLDQLTDHIKKNGQLDFIDMRETFKQAKGNHALFYKADSHWNELAGLICYTEIMERVRNYFPGVKSLTIDDYSIVDREKRGGDLAKMIRLQDILSERILALKPKFASRVSEYKTVEPGKKHLHRQFVFETNRPDQPKAVIFHDSFIWGMSNFMKETFQRTILAHHCGLKFDTELIEREKPDIVIYQFIERVANRKINDPFETCMNF